MLSEPRGWLLTASEGASNGQGTRAGLESLSIGPRWPFCWSEVFSLYHLVPVILLEYDAALGKMVRKQPEGPEYEW